MTDVECPATVSLQVVVRVRPVLPHEALKDVAITCTQDGSKVQVWMSSIVPKQVFCVMNLNSVCTRRRCCRTGPAPIPGRTRVSSPSMHACPAAPARRSCLTCAAWMSWWKQRWMGTGDMVCHCGSVMGTGWLGEELLHKAIACPCRVTIFAFGQTGSGKTHTIIGPRLGALRDAEHDSAHAASGTGQAGAAALPDEEEDGMLARCLRHAFRWAVAREGRLHVLHRHCHPIALPPAATASHVSCFTPLRPIHSRQVHGGAQGGDGLLARGGVVLRDIQRDHHRPAAGPRPPASGERLRGQQRAWAMHGIAQAWMQ